jgi:hypothetical protein
LDTDQADHSPANQPNHFPVDWYSCNGLFIFIALKHRVEHGTQWRPWFGAQKVLNRWGFVPLETHAWISKMPIANV